MTALEASVLANSGSPTISAHHKIGVKTFFSGLGAGTNANDALAFE